jgi:hypothetical protein
MADGIGLLVEVEVGPQTLGRHARAFCKPVQGLLVCGRWRGAGEVELCPIAGGEKRLLWRQVREVLAKVNQAQTEGISRKGKLFSNR